MDDLEIRDKGIPVIPGTDMFLPVHKNLRYSETVVVWLLNEEGKHRKILYAETVSMPIGKYMAIDRCKYWEDYYVNRGFDREQIMVDSVPTRLHTHEIPSVEDLKKKYDPENKMAAVSLMLDLAKMQKAKL